DHGEILAQEKTAIGPEETAGELFERLSILGRDLLLKTLGDLEAGRAAPRPQDHALATPAPKLKKEDGRIDWTLPARAIHARVRGFNPAPGCFTVEVPEGGETARTLRVHRARVEPGRGEPGVMT